MIPKYLYHKIFGGNTCPSHQDIRWALDQIYKEGLVPLVATAWTNLVPENIRPLPIVWLTETQASSRGVWLMIESSTLDKERLFKLDLNDVDWWVYQGNISPYSVKRITDYLSQPHCNHRRNNMPSDQNDNVASIEKELAQWEERDIAIQEILKGTRDMVSQIENSIGLVLGKDIPVEHDSEDPPSSGTPLLQCLDRIQNDAVLLRRQVIALRDRIIT